MIQLKHYKMFKNREIRKKMKNSPNLYRNNSLTLMISNKYKIEIHYLFQGRVLIGYSNETDA